MTAKLHQRILAATIAAASLWIAVAAAAETPSLPASSSSSAPAAAAVPPASLVLARPSEPEDPCRSTAVAAVPTRPTWDFPAATTQCGIVETDYGFLGQPMGGGVNQQVAVTSLRYGLTPKLDLRLALTNRIFQNGGGTASLQGSGDQWLSARYRFHEQGRVTPAMAFVYGAKVPTANPAKGFGTGFVDHQFLFIASRDLGHYHLDFDTIGTLAGGPRGHDGAAQFGLLLTRPLTPKLSAILEGYGGPQPGTPDRFGAGLAGVCFALRPQLVIDGAYSKTYTAGSPRQQFIVGFTYAARAPFSPLPSSSAFARLLGR
ncbi:MAG TPA: hypothetical protein VHZ52_12900 [Acidobacteriaceae bacterium]|jgi:hypothetical protein|nr:hypothetical protein [Acidobacteriaceae bacterium]